MQFIRGKIWQKSKSPVKSPDNFAFLRNNSISLLKVLYDVVWPANRGQAPLWCSTLNFCQRGETLLYSVCPVKLCAFLRSNTLQFIDIRTAKSSYSTRGGLGVPRYGVWRRKHHLDGESLWITTACYGILYRAVQEWFFTCISAVKTELKLKYVLGDSSPCSFICTQWKHKKLLQTWSLLLFGCAPEKTCICVLFVASKLPAFPLNVYHPEACRWKRNPGIAASTIPV